MLAPVLLLADVRPPPARATPVEVWVVIGVVAVVSGLVPMLLRAAGDRKAVARLPEWARAEGLEIVESKVIPGMRGPFAMRGYWTTVMRVTVEAPAGPRSAWICFGNFFVWSFDKVEVVWDSAA